MGREIVRPERGSELAARFIAGCGELCTVERPPIQDGRNMIAILAPQKKTTVKQREQGSETTDNSPSPDS